MTPLPENIPLDKMTRVALIAECQRLRDIVALYEEIEREREDRASRVEKPIVVIEHGTDFRPGAITYRELRP